MELRVLSLCSGVAGFDLGLAQALPTRTVLWVERDPFCQQVLRERGADGSIDQAPVWDDIKTLDAKGFRGKCDLVCGGIPCTPWSTAGKRRGSADANDLWPDALRVLRETEAPLFVLENVARLVRARDGLERVLRDLAGLGFDAEWGVARASDVGAPHRRARVFLLAWLPHARELLLRVQPWWGGGAGGEGQARAGDDREAVADGDGFDVERHEQQSGVERVPEPEPSSQKLADRDLSGCGGGGGQPACHAREGHGDARWHELDGRCSARAEVGDAHGPRLAGWCGPVDVRAHGLPAWPPGPEDGAGWARVSQVRPDLEPAVRGVADGVSPDGLVRDSRGRIKDRRAQLRAYGNAVAAAQAGACLRELVGRACRD